MIDRTKVHESYKLWQPQPAPHEIAPCPLCGARAEVWQYSDNPNSQLQRVVMCTRGDPFGPQEKLGGITTSGCLLYMPSSEFYFATTKEAVRYWNEYATALVKIRMEST